MTQPFQPAELAALKIRAVAVQAQLSQLDRDLAAIEQVLAAYTQQITQLQRALNAHQN